MKTISLIVFALLLPLSALSEVPGKRLDLEINWQQLQALESLDIQQGASMRLIVRPKLSGTWLTLTGITARWEARSTMATTACYSATSGTTSNLLHEIWIDLDSTETGTPVTNWIYGIVLVSGGADYPVGTGLVNIVESGFTGSGAAAVNNNTALTNLAVSAGAAFAASIASQIGTLTYPANTVTGLTGDTEFVIAGSGHAITGSVGSTIARDTEVVSAATAGTNYTDATVATYVPTNSFVADLRCKKLTGTTGASEGDTTSIAHGVTTGNILAFSVLVWQNANWAIVPNRPYSPISAPGVSYYVEIDTGNIDLMLDATESENILEKPITVLVWYTP